MFEKIVVGVDGRSGGRDAIALARELGMSLARVVLANAYGAGGMFARGGETAIAAERAGAHSLLIRERLDSGIAAETVVGCGAPARALHAIAEDEQADLLIVGSSHRGPVARVLLGDDTMAVLRHPPCAVAIAPRGYASAERRLQTIGVADDGSAESRLALEAARALGRRHEAAVRAVSVVSLQSIEPAEAEPLDWSDTTDRAARVERARLAAIADVESEVVYGDPAEQLAALSCGLDLLVVGSRDFGPWDRLLEGSTSTYLARHASCPLLVLARGLTEAGPAVPDGPSRGPRARAAPAS